MSPLLYDIKMVGLAEPLKCTMKNNVNSSSAEVRDNKENYSTTAKLYLGNGRGIV